jgi:hypothetical protein
VLEGLDDVDWAPGVAEVPDLLRAIAEGSQGMDPWWDLDDLLASHEHVAADMRPALPTVVLPYLVDLAQASDSMRETLLEAIADLWVIDAAGSIDALDPTWSPAWAEQVPRLLAFLADPDVAVRRRALLALAETTGPAVAGVVEGLRSHRDGETDDLTTIDLAHAIGRLVGLESSDPMHQWLRGRLEGDDLEARYAAAAVLVKHDPEHVPAQDALADAVRAGDFPSWERTSWLLDGRRSPGDWATDAPGRLDRRVETCLKRLDDPDDATRIRAVTEAALLVATWRSPQESLLPAIAAHMGDPANEARAYAIHVVAACGPASAPFADQVADLMGDATAASKHGDETIGDLAVWALARIGDRRCVDELREQVRGARDGFDVWSSAGGHPHFYLLDMPAMHQVLGPLRELVPELLPAVRERMRTSDDYQWRREMAQTVAAWGADAAAAVPELVELLSTDAAGWAAHALGEMGPAAESAASELRRFARGPAWTARLRTSRQAEYARGRLSLPSPDRRPHFDANNRRQAAWAYARITGDVDVAVRVLGSGLGGKSARPAVRLLATLGPLATDRPLDDRLLERVRELVEDGDDWDRVDAAQIHWRLTGDPGVAVDRMVESLRPLERAFFEPQMRLAVDYAGELGPAAADAAPALRALLAIDRRLGQTGSWQSIEEDLDLRRRAAVALARVTGEGRETESPGRPQ